MILVVNAGSSSIKAAVFDAALSEVAAIDAEEIGGAARIVSGKDEVRGDLPDHAAALAAILDRLAADGLGVRGLRSAGHRVVHGGAALTAPCRITDAVRADIAAQIPLAPLHNPVNLAGIDALTRLAPELPQVASFDTAFHATNPAIATTYALPAEWQAKGLRRYGFHGLSYASLVARLDPLPERLLACHLGNGASLCAIRAGRSVATTMGYSPLSGLVMGTRAGEIDGNAVLRIAEDLGVEAAGELLNRRSGLLAMGGSSDMRALLEDAPEAVEAFTYWAARQAGSMIVAMGGLDAVAFTGGIGENAGAVRDGIADALRWAGDVPMHVLPAEEERQIARDTRAVLGD